MTILLKPQRKSRDSSYIDRIATQITSSLETFMTNEESIWNNNVGTKMRLIVAMRLKSMELRLRWKIKRQVWQSRTLSLLSKMKSQSAFSSSTRL